MSDITPAVPICPPPRTRSQGNLTWRLLWLAATALACCAPASLAAELPGPPTTGETVTIGDIRMHYLRSGDGPPVVLVHGGYGSSEQWSNGTAQYLAKDFTVIAADSRGRGRTTVGNGPITSGRMAHDLVGLLDALGMKRAHFIGHSEGGGVVLSLLVDYPDRVISAVLTGTTADISDPRQLKPGALKELRAEVAALAASASPSTAALKQRYEAVSPEPGRWNEVAARLGIWLLQPNFPAPLLGTIRRPVLVVGADRDEYISRDGFSMLAAAIPGAKVYHAGDVTHAIWRDRSDTLPEVAAKFMKAQQPP